MGAGDPTAAQFVGASGSLSSGMLSILAPAMAAGPIGIAIGLAAVLGSLIFSYIGGGCGQACIDASKMEQIYETAGNNAHALVTIGMVTAIEAVAFLRCLIYAGEQHEAALNTKQGQAGSSNMTNDLNAEIAAVQNSSSPGGPIDLNEARSLYVVGSPGHWYGDAAAAGAQLTDAWLEQLQADPSRLVPADTSNISTTIAPAAVSLTPSPTVSNTPVTTPANVVSASPSSFFSSIPAWAWLAGAGVLAWEFLR